MNSHYIIHAALLGIISLLVWMVLYVVWGSGNSNMFNQHFQVDPIRVVYRDNTPLFDGETVTHGDTATYDSNRSPEVQLQRSQQTATSSNLEHSAPNPRNDNNQLTIVIDATRPSPATSQPNQKDSETNTNRVSADPAPVQTPENRSSGSRVTVVKLYESAAGTSNTQASISSSNRSAGQTATVENDAVKAQQTSSGLNSPVKVADSDFDIRLATVKTMTNSAAQPTFRDQPESITGVEAPSKSTNQASPATTPLASLEPAESEPATTLALTLSFEYDQKNCSETPPDTTLFDIYFRHESAAIKGFSLVDVDNMIAYYGRCAESTFKIAHHPNGAEDATQTLQQRRRDELFYYLMHMRVEKSDIVTLERP